MKKVAIFVEGYTEFFFVQRMIEELAGYGGVRFELMMNRDGRIIFLKHAGAPEEAASLYVMLVNCCGDGTVKSCIMERKQHLMNVGYTEILGLQDLFPLPLQDLARLEEGISKGLQLEGIKISMYIAVAEIEAWFLNEATHYLRVHECLTSEVILEHTQFDPKNHNAETTIRHPAVLLDKIYTLAGLKYKKRQAEMHRLIATLDYTEIYTEVRENSASLNKFLTGLEEAIAVA